MNTVILGLLYGDEGKGKIVDYQADKHDIIVRFQGGPNAGHTIYRNNKKIVLHQIPSGILSGKPVVIGNGCIVDIFKLIQEIDMLIESGYTDVLNLLHISHCAHVITQKHIDKDVKKENSGKGNGSTKCGIGPCYSDKYAREGIRIYQFLEKHTDFSYEVAITSQLNTLSNEQEQRYNNIYNNLKKCVCDTTNYLQKSIDQGKNILFEGAQGVFLSIDNFMYPNVSSSNVDIGGVISGTGVNHKQINNVLGIVKSYMSRVGDGPFVTQISGEDEKKLRDVGQEYGATTGRPRKVGWLDLPMIKYACKVVGVDQLAITRIDTLIDAFGDKETIPVCVDYSDKSGMIWGEFPTFEHQYLTDNVHPMYIDVPMFNYEDVEQFINNDVAEKAQNNSNNFTNFIHTIERYTQTPIKMISFGKNKEDVYCLK